MPQWRLPPVLLVQAPIPLITSKKRYERLSTSVETSRRRPKRYESLTNTSVKPVQTCNQTKQKRKQHRDNLIEQYEQTIDLQKSLIEALKAQISESENSEKPHRCPECVKSFQRSDHVRSHIRIKHKQLALASSIDNIYCKKCEKYFARPIYLTKHSCSPNSPCRYPPLRCKMSILIRFHTASSSPVRCESCNLDLSSSSSLVRHEKSEKHRQLLGRSIDQDLSLVPKEGASCCQDTHRLSLKNHKS